MAALVFAQMYYPYSNRDWGLGWGVGSSVLSFLFFVFIIWLIFRLLRSHNSDYHGHHHQDPLEIAKRRYARGEINKEEFEQIKKDLNE